MALSEYETVKASDSLKENSVPSLQQEKDLSLGENLDIVGKGGVLKEDAPVTKIVSTILRYAIEGRSSDVHIEPAPSGTKVRFRMDGELHTSLQLPKRVHDAVVTRIKILAKLR